MMEASETTCAPAWETVAEEVECPLCGYNLRGLTDPRCPECGYQFEWRDILDARRRRHPFLFEHHPERNVWSFLRTAVASTLPRSFWRSLHPVMPSRAGRIVAYWVIASFVLVLGVASLCAQPFVNDPLPFGMPGAPGAGTWTRFVYDFPDFEALVEAAFIATLWPWLLCAVLMIFQASMKRARIRRVHVLRSTVYSMADAGLWVAFPLMIAAAIPLLNGQSATTGWAVNFYGYGAMDPKVMLWLTGVGIAGIALGAWRLATAYRVYLQFRHPRAVVFCAELIAVLIVLFILLNTDSMLGSAYREVLEMMMGGPHFRRW